MADPLTMAAVGAVAGAAMNRDDPMKGALMGAALGGAGGAGYGALTGAGGAAAGTAAGSAAAGGAELAALEALPPGLANLPLGPTGLLPVDVFPVNAYPAAETIPVFNNEAIAQASMGGDYAGLGSGASGSSMYGGADLSWMDRISPSQQAAIETGKLPGAFQMPSLGGAMSALSQSQPRTQMSSPGGIRRGQPQAVNYGGLASLLEPKLVERRRLSLL